jgi:hypothetical protein
MFRWISIPFLSYILLLPVVTVMETIGGRGAVGASAIDEYLIIVQLVILWNIFRIIRNRGFTKDPE